MQDVRATTFLTVCKTRNYTRAAEELHITQPAVSQHISYLEKDYGAKLFTYHNRQLHLTKAGELLYRAFIARAHDDELLHDRIAALTAHQRIHIKLGATLTAGQYMVAAPLAAYLKSNPDLSLSIHSGDTQTLLSQLERGDLDCAFVEGFFESSTYERHVFCEEALWAIASPTRLLPSAPARLEDLLGYPLIVREPGSGTRAVLEHALAAVNLSLDSFDSVVEVGSLNITKTFVEVDLGISFVYESAVKTEVNQGALQHLALTGPALTHPITFVYLKGSVFAHEFESLFEGVVQQRETLASS